ncbi:MAG: endonuclease/exonuclease/phosphatase family protein [Prevotella sp.]|nr:endonuclease/exonuclease/phosphatase family protein [Prevotella sp.]
MKKLKSIIFGLIAGANIVTILVMLLLGFADHVSPADHPTLSTLGLLFPFAALANLAFLFFWLIVKWRWALIPFVGFLVAYAPMRVYMPMNLPSSPPDDAIKVISFNSAGFVYNINCDNPFEQLTDYLRQSKADILCIQEDNNGKQKMTDFYNSLYPYNDTVKVNTSKSSPNNLGIHTRFPILRKEVIDYYSPSNGSVAWYLKVGNDTLIVINNHLESSHLNQSDRSQYEQIVAGGMKGDTARTESRRLLGKLAEAAVKRAPAADSVHQYIERHAHYPILVCGDFNDHPLSYTRRTIAKGLTDCFVSTGNGLGISFNHYDMYFRIDHMMCSQNITPYHCFVDSKIVASDHYPVICWLKIDRNH